MFSAIQSEKNYYVYTLAYPDGRVFYVGKGKKSFYNSSDRVKVHESEARHGGEKEKHRVIRGLHSQGLSPLVKKLFYTDDEQEALLYEAALIILMNATGHLTNIRYGNKQTKKTLRKRRTTLPAIIENNGETYYSVTEASNRLDISRPSFRKYIKPQLPEYHYGILKRTYYRERDLDHYRGVRRVDNGDDS